MPQRRITGSAYCRASAPSGMVATAATDTGATSRQLQRRVCDTVNGMLATLSVIRSVMRGDPRIIDGGHQRHIDQRRAEAGKAAHDSGQRRDQNGRDETRLGDKRGKGYG